MRKRFIPVLLIDKNRRLVKTVNFDERTYVGDPFNVVRLFNEKEVDEICILDIDATVYGYEPDIGFISELASECFMPLSYGGGLNNIQQCKNLNRNGVEKIVVGTASTKLDFIQSLSEEIGSQAVVACVDVRGKNELARCFTNSGRVNTNLAPIDYCLRLQDSGVGEIILQSVDFDGQRSGYDLELIRSVSSELTLPVVALGGAGEYSHLMDAIKAGASAAASGSTFCFIGRLRAVLVNYPDMDNMNLFEQKGRS